MKFKIGAGLDFETTTPHEMRGMLSEGQQSWFAEMARGLKHFELSISGAVSGGALSIDGSQQVDGGPREGFAWAVQRLSCDLLASADVLKVYRGAASTTGERYIGPITSTGPLRLGSKSLILKGGQFMSVTGAGLATTAATLVITGEAIEVPEFMLWKIL